MKKFVLIFLTLLSVKQIFGSAADILSEDPWRVLQYKFVTKPEKKANSWKNLGIKGATAIGSGCATYGLYGFIHSRIFDNDFSVKYQPKFGASKWNKGTYYPMIPTSLIGSALAYYITNQLFIRNYQKAELFDLLKNWDKYKKHIPASLLNKLNEVRHEYVQNRAEIEDQADEIIEVIMSQINLHFYGDPKAKNFFDIRTLSANFNTHFVLDFAKIINSLINAFQAYNGTNGGTNNTNHSKN